MEGNTFDQILDRSIVFNSSFGFDAGDTVISNNAINRTSPVAGYGQSGEGYSYVVNITSSGVVFEYNVIDNTGNGGLLVSNGANIIRYNVVRNTGLTHNDVQCIYVQSNGNQIRNNFLLDTFGYMGGSGTYNDFTFGKLAFGIVFGPNTRTGNIVDGNTISGHPTFGIYCDHARENQIKNNVFYNNDTGIYFYGDEAGDSYNNTMAGNVFYSLSPSQMGIRVHTSNDFGTFESNYHVNPYNENVIREDQAGGCRIDYSLPRWQSVYPARDQNSIGRFAAFDLYSVTNSGTELVENGGFSDGTTGWWGGNSEIAADNSRSEMDGQSLKITTLTGSAGISGNNFSIFADQYYRLTFSVLGESFGNVHIRSYDETPVDWIILEDQRFALDTSRKNHAFIFKAMADTSLSRPWFNTTTAVPIYWLDTVSVIPVEVSANDPKINSRMFFNATKNHRTFNYGTFTYKDLDNVTVTGPTTVAPFTSKILAISASPPLPSRTLKPTASTIP